MKYAPFFLWLLLIFTAMALAFIPDLVKIPRGADKMLHILMASSILIGPTVIVRNLKYVYGLAFSMFIFGLGLECIQYLIPDRNAELKDIAANTIGIILGLFIGLLIRSGYQAGAKIHKINTHSEASTSSD